ncbi:amidohydrolase family protein [Nordella sp. HKS 07]|uniref:amidohydrolase family protein n=1 Tax=Nordella sp. HKS 07 TaxID=2712222 RepID=UPI0013E1AF40|nr:amidohydrolase family protein [Nordella sp. HKS 07]QIG52251.1 amidohydrolase family protein [Nordella sp. HKS 07]
MPDFPIVDSHVHLADPSRFGYAWTRNAPSLNRRVLPADFIKAANGVKIDRFVFVEVDVDLPQHLAEAEWIAGLAQNDKRLAGMVAALPLERGKAIAAELDRLRQNKILRAVRRLIQNQADPGFCIRPEFIDGLRLLAQHDIAFDICVLHHQMPNVIKMVSQCPDVRFVLDHIGKPGIKAGIFDPWRQQLKELAAFPNVHCKISGVSTEADHKNWTREQLKPYIAHTIDTFGFDRIMFGGDWHVLELAGTYPDWVDIVDWVVEGASADEKRKLFRDNAIRFYRLDQPE